MGQAVAELVLELPLPATTAELRGLSAGLEEAMANAVGEHGRLRAQETAERLGYLAHELRNLLHTAFLALEELRTRNVGLDAGVGGVLGRSLIGLRDSVDRELAGVRLAAGVQQRERIPISQFLEEVELAASLDAQVRCLQLTASRVEHDVTVHGDRHILRSVVANLLQNAFKFTPRGGQVSLSVSSTPAPVLIAVEDQCGGLPHGRVEELFQPFTQRGKDRSGLGLGLALCRQGALASGGKIQVTNRQGQGCVFALELPRYPASAAE